MEVGEETMRFIRDGEKGVWRWGKKPCGLLGTGRRGYGGGGRNHEVY